MRKLLPLVCLAGCAHSATAPLMSRVSPAEEDRASATITAAGLLRHTTILSSDRFEGRAPGTNGEELTVGYVDAEMRRVGLTTMVQTVPMIAALTTATSVSLGGPLLAFRPNDDFVAWSYTDQRARLDSSEVIFVGYGIVAPELGRDDFKDVDVTNKVVVFLSGDPFDGPALTYYGRWTYKFQIAAKKGAAAALIIHETGPAGYGWNVVSGGGARERYEIATDAARGAHPKVEGWVHEQRARQLFIAGGSEFDTAKAAARKTDFRPLSFASPIRAQIDITSTFRDVSSRNVVGRLIGSDPRRSNEHVMYSAHWDHFGRSPDGSVFHGALDNASGVAWLLESAQAFASLPHAPHRSMLFIAFTAEEQGLLGAKYYGDHPLFPLASTAADINMDIMNPWGRARSLVSISDGKTTMDPLLAAEALRQGRRVVPDPEPFKGYYFRSDHFELAKRGVPALGFLFPGADYRDQPADYGQRKRSDYIARMYHSPLDVVQPDWDLSGAVEDTQLLFRVGLRLAEAEGRPELKK